VRLKLVTRALFQPRGSTLEMDGLMFRLLSLIGSRQTSRIPAGCRHRLKPADQRLVCLESSGRQFHESVMDFGERQKLEHGHEGSGYRFGDVRGS